MHRVFGTGIVVDKGTLRGPLPIATLIEARHARFSFFILMNDNPPLFSSMVA